MDNILKIAFDRKDEENNCVLRFENKVLFANFDDNELFTLTFYEQTIDNLINEMSEKLDAIVDQLDYFGLGNYSFESEFHISTNRINPTFGKPEAINYTLTVTNFELEHIYIHFPDFHGKDFNIPLTLYPNLYEKFQEQVNKIRSCINDE